MRILMANHDMEYLGGTQVWLRQIHDVLADEHDVDVYVHRGKVPDGIRAYTAGARYDLALINHFPAFRDLRKADITKRIVTCHGVIPAEEWPSPGSDAYVSVSEAVQQHIPYRSTVIRNPIDPNRFTPSSAPGAVLRKVAFVSNRQGAAKPLIEAACALLPDVELRIVGMNNGIANPEIVYNWADLVIGIARTAMEALACERNVIAFDYMGMHGLVTEENMAQMREHNFGGHAQGSWPTPEELATEITRYDPSRNLRDKIVIDQTPQGIAQAYLDLAARIRPSVPAALIRRGPNLLTSPKITSAASKIKRLLPANAFPELAAQSSA